MRHLLFAAATLAPPALMLLAMLSSQLPSRVPTLWRTFMLLSGTALACALLAAGAAQPFAGLQPWIGASRLAAAMGLLVQLLGTVIGAFSARYLDGEPGQRRYVAALSGVLSAVHLLLLAGHWLVFIAAWALVGVALRPLLCFYPDRPFALLAAYKKRIADRAADVLLAAAAALAWSQAGSGSFADLWSHIGKQGMSAALQASAVCLVLAVILRSALLPVHGWLIQVMEAPTPVSALLHAGVVNLGGYVLIRFAPLLEQAMPARLLLVGFGLGTAVLAGLVMLTRISIKVRLAWSTTAQMGFMVLECGLGLYTLAALHLIGHSLYKAHAFLSASSVVRQTRLEALRSRPAPAPASLLAAPVVSVATVLLVQSACAGAQWPWWWSTVLGLAWAPLLWLPGRRDGVRPACVQALSGIALVAGLAGATLLAHAVPLGMRDAPDAALGMAALSGMAALYLCLAVLQRWPQALQAWQRRSYAGFYLDEVYTRLALQLCAARWIPPAARGAGPATPILLAADTPL